ncbi:MAG: hypothetical protein ACFCVA_08115 [Gammaproteobacteria bacterium]
MQNHTQNVLNNILRYACIVALGFSLGAAPGYVGAYERQFEHPPSASLMVLDAFVFRPATLALTAVGGVAFVLTLPFSATGGNIEQAKEKLVLEPWRFTFNRPLGQFP